MTSVNSSLAGQLDVSGLTATTPIVANVSIPIANTEVSYALPSSTKFFKIQNRSNGLMKLAYSVGTSGTTYWTLFPGQQYCENNIASSASLTLYFQSPQAAQLLEVISWS